MTICGFSDEKMSWKICCVAYKAINYNHIITGTVILSKISHRK